MRQYGPQPHLPEPHQFLLPPMSVPRGGGLEAGRGARGRGGAEGAGHRYRAPAPAHCLRIERRHPGGGEERPRQRPLQAQGLHQGKVKARGGAAAKGGNQLTPCWATRTATDCRSREPCSSITSTRPMAWPTSATPSVSPTPTATRHLQKRARPPRWPRQVGRDGRASAERRSQVPVVCRGQSCLSYSRR